MTHPVEDLRFGIEAEYLVLDRDGRALDLDAHDHTLFQQIVDRLPDDADPDLTRGDLAIKWSRWYVEGDERYDDTGAFLRCVPKGIETRTPICSGIAEAVAAVSEQTRRLEQSAAVDGATLAAVGRHPWRRRYVPDPPFTAWERRMRRRHREYAAPQVYMCSYGPDVNLSHPVWDAQRCLDAGARLARLAPALVAFSLDAPLAGGRRWPGYSARTHARAGRRPTVRVFLDPPSRALATAAVLTPGLQICAARIPAEVGRIEFKAFDAFPDLTLFGSLLALVAAVVLADDAAVPGPPPAWVDLPVAEQLRRTGRHGLDDDALRQWTSQTLEAADAVLTGSDEAGLLAPLARSLDSRRVPAHEIIDPTDGRAPRTLPPISHPSR